MTKGYVSLVLHTHMPFIRHPEVDDAMEERWFFEAMNECYLPLINVYDKLLDEKVDFKITMSITPPVMSMMEDEYLNERYEEYLLKAIELSEKEKDRTKYDLELNKVALFYGERLNNLLNIYNSYDKRIMNAFRKFDGLGCIEIITCSATHAYLPLLTINIEAVRAQIAMAVESYTKFMGHGPEGIWLPECAYCKELDAVLKEFEIKYFISENMAIMNAVPQSVYGTFTPVATEGGICAFGRDVEASSQVWSSIIGYPGDVNYREFYRDIGFELPLDYIGPYINKSGIRLDTGMKYYKITGNTNDKQYYIRAAAMERVKSHAKHFVSCRNVQINNMADFMKVPPIITCPYDTELFGHWWFEGPDFIEEFIRNSCNGKNIYELITPSEYIKKYPVVQCCELNPSSWGENGDNSVWLNENNQWIYRRLHEAEEKMNYLADTYGDVKEFNEEKAYIYERALKQAARELMLAEASDWPFIIKNNTTAEYAKRRVNTHLDRFNKLYEQIVMDKINNVSLQYIEELDNIFPDIDYGYYKSI